MEKILVTEQLKKMFQKQPFFTAAGVYYGFPTCCIESFIDNKQFETFKKYPQHPFIGTGFVPCLDCAKKSEKDHLSFYANMEKNRFCKSSLFSKEESNTDELINKFFIDFICHLKENPIDIISEIPNSLYSIKTFLPELSEFTLKIEMNNKTYSFNIEGILKSKNKEIINKFFLFLEDNQIDFYFKPLIFYIKDSNHKEQIDNYYKLSKINSSKYSIKTTKEELIDWLKDNNPDILRSIKLNKKTKRSLKKQ